MFQIREYVNRLPGELVRAIVAAFADLAGATFKWTAPLASERYAEPQDAAFLRAIGRPELSKELASFWPKGGPVWDGLAVTHLPDGTQGAILLEAKSYPGELRGGGMAAKSPASRKKILDALAQTQAWLGVEPNPERWTQALYQSANRYAHLFFLRELCRVPAWLVHVLFLNDATYIGATQTEWETALPAIERELGLKNSVPFAGHVFLPAVTPSSRMSPAGKATRETGERQPL
jgi:hypothetical protein